MKRAKERWGLSVVVFVAVAGTFAFAFMRTSGWSPGTRLSTRTLGGTSVDAGEPRPSGEPPSRPPVETGKILYNYHSFEQGVRLSEPETSYERGGAYSDGPKSFIYHKVERGESLWKIARRYNTGLQSILTLNDIGNPDLIYTGAMLVIEPNAS